jgi:ATP-dependent DNA ligase
MTSVLLPMLATPAAPFDGEDYLFELKWDGIRALAASEGDGRWRLWGRAGADYTPRYPELAVLSKLPAGTVVDGELVVLRDGRADFPALLRRHQRHRPGPLGLVACCGQPVVIYVMFDLLFAQGQSVLRQTLLERRQQLQELVGNLKEPLLVYSEGVVGCGRTFFTNAVAQGHEGVMAKHLGSCYRPGRSASWKKIKPRATLPCLIIGYQVQRERIHRLLMATMQAGVLRYVGRLRPGSGQPDLAQRLAIRRRSQPLVPCPVPACWIEPEFYCRIACHGWTNHGRLRYPIFAGWLDHAP